MYRDLQLRLPLLHLCSARVSDSLCGVVYDTLPTAGTQRREPQLLVPLTLARAAPRANVIVTSSPGANCALSRTMSPSRCDTIE
jgi:hypothetical protein